MINLDTKFHFSMCNQSEENERKLQIIEISLNPRAISRSKMAPSDPNQFLT
jgi:hypothetical protein